MKQIRQFGTDGMLRPSAAHITDNVILLAQAVRVSGVNSQSDIGTQAWSELPFASILLSLCVLVCFCPSASRADVGGWRKRTILRFGGAHVCHHLCADDGMLSIFFICISASLP